MKNKSNNNKQISNNEDSINFENIYQLLLKKRKDEKDLKDGFDEDFEEALEICSVYEVEIKIESIYERELEDELQTFIDDIRTTPYNETHQLMQGNPLYKLGIDIIQGKESIENVVQLIDEDKISVGEKAYEYCVELYYYIKTHYTEIPNPLLYIYILNTQAEGTDFLNSNLRARIIIQFCEELIRHKGYSIAFYFLKVASAFTYNIFDYLLILKKIVICCGELEETELLKKVPPVIENLEQCFQEISKKYTPKDNQKIEHEQLDIIFRIDQTLKKLHGKDLSLESADSANSYAKQYYNYRDNNNALNLFFEAKKIYKIHNEGLKIAEVNEEIGRIFWYQNKYGKAIKLIKAAENIYIKHDMQDEVISCKKTLRKIYAQNDEVNKAIEINFELQKYYQEQNNMDEVAKCDLSISYCYSYLGKADKEIAALKSAHKIYMENNIIEKEAQCKRSIGKFYIDQNEVEKAICQFEEAVIFSKKYNIKDDITYCLWSLVKLYYSNNQIEKAVDINQALRKISEENHDEIEKAKCDCWFGGIELKLGNEEKAWELLIPAKSVLKESDECKTCDLAQCNFFIGEFFLNRQKYEMAKYHFEVSKELVKNDTCRHCEYYDSIAMPWDEKIKETHTKEGTLAIYNYWLEQKSAEASEIS